MRMVTRESDDYLSSALKDREKFLNQTNFELTLASPFIIDKLANRLSNEEKKDDICHRPPLEHIQSLEQRRQEIIDYIERIRIHCNNIDSATTIQTNIHKWFTYNWKLFLYKPTGKEKETLKSLFAIKFKLENIIGTIHFLPFLFRDSTFHFCFAISNYRIVYWSFTYSQQNAYSDVYHNLKYQQKWPKNAKFATEMEVDDAKSDIFIHTSNKDVFVENEKVVTWIKNNFNLKQQNNQYTGRCVEFILSLYNFFVNFYN